MPAAPLPADESNRLQALHALDILDTPPEAELDALVKAASLVCGVPISLISLVDKDRQWFKANVGLPGATETHRDLAFCAHAILQDDLMEVPDALADPRFAENGLVTGAPDIRYYAGLPLTLSNGARVGTLCVIDTVPRMLDQTQRAVLAQLGIAATKMLENSQKVRKVISTQKHFSTLGEAAPVGIFTADAQGGCTYTNRLWQEIYGLNGEDSLGTGWSAALHPEDRAKVFAEWGVCADLQADFKMNFRVQRKDGSTRHVHSVSRPVVENGCVVSHVGVVEDVTDLLQAQLALQHSENRFRDLVKALDVGVSIHGPDTLIQYVNASALRLLGLTEDQMLGKTSFDPRWNVIDQFHHPLPGDLHPSSQAAKTGKIVRNVVMGVFRPITEDRVWLLVTAVPELDSNGQVLRVTVSFSDISEQRRAEEEASRTHQILTGSIDALNEAFALYDAQERLVLFNKPYIDLFPDDEDAVQVGNTFENILRSGASRGMFASDEERLEEWVQERLALHRQPSSELIHKLADGRVLKSVEKRMPNGYSVGFRYDITDLVLATEAAEQASRSKGQFLATMSHEIRTPMNAILGMLQLLHGTDLNARQMGYVQKTEGAARSLLGILNDILDFSKVEAGKMQLDPEPFALDRLVEELGTIVAGTVGAKPVELLMDVDPRIPNWLVGDALRLKQVLINLAGNAVKFTSQGQVVIRVKQQAKGTLLFEVQDSGIGMSPEQASRVFAGFSQAEASIARRFGGTGLGLAISQRLVRLMGGELAVSTAEGLGSTFYFEVALPHAMQASQRAGNSALPSDWTNVRALVLHQDELVANHWATLCQQVGWQPEVTLGRDAALVALEQACSVGEPKKLLLLNWQSGSRSVVNFVADAHAVHRKHGANALKVLAMTNTLVDPMAELPAGQRQMVNAVGVKPLTPGALQQMATEIASGVGATQQSAGNTNARSTEPKATGGKRRLKGLRILLVEDNLLNQEVAMELLGREDAVVTLAENGQLAVESLQSSPQGFDLVLMDMQMPVMDGLQATRHIRRQLGLETMPILAMTANAMASDRDQCDEAGMNGHVGKPFDIDDLVDKILVITGRQDKTHFRTSPEINRATPARTGLTDHNAALKRLGGDTRFFGRLLRTFASTSPAILGQAIDALKSRDWRSAGTHLHTLKGTASALGATELARAAAGAEACAKEMLTNDRPSGDPVAELTLLRHPTLLVDSLDILFAELRSWEPPTLPNQVDRKQDRVALEDSLGKLVALLKLSDMESLDLFDTMSEQGLPATAKWQKLQQCMEDMDLEGALSAAVAIAQPEG